MEYTHSWILIAVILVQISSMIDGYWQKDWIPNYVSLIPESQNVHNIFDGRPSQPDDFKLLLVEGDRAFVGAMNRLYYISLSDVTSISTLEWEPSQVAVATCKSKGKRECDNYIRVVVRKDDGLLYVCGTNAYQPKCRHYQLKDDKFTMDRMEEKEGTGVCPFNPSQNSTILYTDGKLYSATVTDSDARDPLILQSRMESDRMRTRKGDSVLLNEPNFVSSFDKDDKVLFFFRETATEHINCGKTIFSRVARVCKKDLGGMNNKFQFTSFFKARLNCSIPGDYPFYFDELQSTSDFGQGNLYPTADSGDRSDMVYGVFNTPENSIRGSAVCAFRHSDIAETFRGRFKEQTSIKHNWLPVSWEDIPTPHPEKCVDGTVPLNSLKFIKSHPLMNDAIPAQGGRPLLVFTSFKARFTQIAIDWQVLAADGRYYDVVFVGTDDGRVIKAINKGPNVDSVVIEDLQVMESDEPIVGLKVISNRVEESQQKLVVMSRKRIVSIPLHRCDRAKSCSSCVELQDPYCAWSSDLKQCFNTEKGFQSIQSGNHDSCEVEPKEKPTATTATVPVISECLCPEVVVKTGLETGKKAEVDNTKPDKPEIVSGSGQRGNNRNEEKENEERVAGASMGPVAEVGVSADIFVIVIVVSIILSLLLGFFIGFKVQSCRYSRDRDNVFYDRGTSSLQRGVGRNRLSSGDNPYFHTDHTSLAPKKLNHVVNMKNGKANTGIETIPVTKSNKVYL